MAAPGRLPLPAMRGRDPHERGRTASPLELLYDLTFVVAVGVAADRLAEGIATGNTATALIGFVLAMFAIMAGWINFSWFASAFDTDDWVYRTLTMVQMIGVVVLALGIAPMFHDLEVKHALDLDVIVAGYVVMRVALVALWIRVLVQAPAYRGVASRNASLISVAQLGWVALAAAGVDLPWALTAVVVLGAFELAVPVLAQGHAAGTPWHPHHIAERYSLFAIIALGEGVVGTAAASQAALGGAEGIHWSQGAVTVLVAGLGITFAVWWTYFTIPFGELLSSRPRRGYLFGYGHIPLIMAIAAIGAGLHLAALHLSVHDARHGAVSEGGVVLALATPVGILLVAMTGLLIGLGGRLGAGDLGGLAIALVLLAVALVIGANGSMSAGLLLVMLSSAFPVVGHELSADRPAAREALTDPR